MDTNVRTLKITKTNSGNLIFKMTLRDDDSNRQSFFVISGNEYSLFERMAKGVSKYYPSLDDCAYLLKITPTGIRCVFSDGSQKPEYYNFPVANVLPYTRWLLSQTTHGRSAEGRCN